VSAVPVATPPPPPQAAPVAPVLPSTQAVPLESNRAPVYPELARSRGWQGVVRVELSVDAEGDVTAIEIVSSSGFPVLDGAVRKAAADWRFQPATRDGTACPSTVTRTTRFTF
jgi:periplasmic protein TonB